MSLFDKIKKEASSNNEENKKPVYPTQTMLCIRVIVAGYLLYLSYDLFVTREASSIKLWQLILILAIFVICSVYIIANSIYLFVKGMYVGGKADVEKEPENINVFEEIACEANETAAESTDELSVSDEQTTP